MKIRNDTDKTVTYTVTAFEPGTVVYQRLWDEDGEDGEEPVRPMAHPSGFLVCQEIDDEDDPTLFEWRWHPTMESALSSIDDGEEREALGTALRNREDEDGPWTHLRAFNYEVRRTPEGLPKWWGREVH
jgi:hypothetical protein